MSMHLAAWAQSLDPAGAWTALDACTDDRLFTEGKNIRVPPLNRILLAHANVS